MARFVDYLDTGYLPGEIRQSTYGAAALNPMAITKYEANKRWKFQPETKGGGASFQDFMNWQNNPDAAMSSKIKLPAGFLAFNQMASGYN
jgi:hypothetical protein